MHHKSTTRQDNDRAGLAASFLTPANPGEGFMTEAQWAASAAIIPLTKREVDVAILLLLDLPRKTIARRLGICARTVRVHFKHLFDKLRVDGRLGLALRFASVRGALAAKA